MTDTNHEDAVLAALDDQQHTAAELAMQPLPTEVEATMPFIQRLPSQRVIDELAKLDPTPFGDLQEQQPSRVLAFRVLLRDYPGRDISSLWMHAYDVEVEIIGVDPSSVLAQMRSPTSAPTGA